MQFRDSNRAYLIEIRRADAGTVLIYRVSHGGDPIAAMGPVAEVLNTDEWIPALRRSGPALSGRGRHAAAGAVRHRACRTAGRVRRVNLVTMVERLLGFGLAKGHGAADWSKRPLPAEWLNVAALDVELLLELRAAISNVLAEQGKTDWAAQEFHYLVLGLWGIPAGCVMRFAGDECWGSLLPWCAHVFVLVCWVRVASCCLTLCCCILALGHHPP